jgi:hypothetical protein
MRRAALARLPQRDHERAGSQARSGPARHQRDPSRSRRQRSAVDLRRHRPPLSVPSRGTRPVCSGYSSASSCKDGGRTRARTWDPMIKSHLLYQLSYAPGTGPEMTLARGRRLAKRPPDVQQTRASFPALCSLARQAKSRRIPAAFPIVRQKAGNFAQSRPELSRSPPPSRSKRSRS